MGKRFQFAIDRGGTFTDVYARCPNGKVRVMKLLSVDPQNYSDAPREAIRRILQEVRKDLSVIHLFHSHYSVIDNLFFFCFVGNWQCIRQRWQSQLCLNRIYSYGYHSCHKRFAGKERSCNGSGHKQGLQRFTLHRKPGEAEYISTGNCDTYSMVQQLVLLVTGLRVVGSVPVSGKYSIDSLCVVCLGI